MLESAEDGALAHSGGRMGDGGHALENPKHVRRTGRAKLLSNPPLQVTFSLHTWCPLKVSYEDHHGTLNTRR